MTLHDLFTKFRNLVSDLAAQKFTGETAFRIHWNQGGIGKIIDERKEVVK